jgi:hypothetical protein
MKTLASFLAITALAFSMAGADEPVIVHEWGTFTCLQDEQGKAIGGINVDDEPVPGFVWQYANRLVAGLRSPDEDNFGLPPYEAGGKGWISGDPKVTMRLETPVLYLYPPKGRAPQSVPPLDVHVDFHGGILSQYYPYATTNGALLNGTLPYLASDHKITADTTTGLTWNGVQLGVDGKQIPSTDPIVRKGAPWLRGEVVATDDKVWTTPRDVSAPLLGVKFAILQGYPAKSYDCAQAEHFIFYRGVGNLDSSLRIDTTLRSLSGTAEGARADETATLQVRTQNGSGDLSSFSECWLVQIRADGTCAFHDRDLSERNIPVNARFIANAFGMGPNFTFREDQFSADNLTKLKASMHNALVKEGLYDDEATAMLKTWELSYFKSPGLRFFYIVPRAWVDKVLPLSVTGAPTEITRVMVGRIELITDAQKKALTRLSVGPCPDLAALKKAAVSALAKVSAKERQPYYSGEKPLSDLSIAIPPLIQDYLSLGRFRDALIIHTQQQHPSAALAQFIKDNQLAEH